METYYVLALALEDLALAVWLLCIGLWIARVALARRRLQPGPPLTWWLATILPGAVLVAAAAKLGAGLALGRGWWPQVVDAAIFIVITGLLSGLTAWRTHLVRELARSETKIAAYEEAVIKLRDGDTAGARAIMAEVQAGRQRRWL